MDLNIIKAEETPKEQLSLKTPKVKTEVKNYEVEKVELSKNIQKFDRKVKVYTQDPFSFNSVTSKKVDYQATPTASQMIADPIYNAIGKLLGVDATREWNLYYDKVLRITEWAKKKTKSDKLGDIVRFIEHKGRTLPSMGARRIDDLYIHSGLSK